jgi:hypothetical protein
LAPRPVCPGLFIPACRIRAGSVADYFFYTRKNSLVELRYLRNKEKKEIDFLVLKNNKPWFPVEVKLNQDKPSENWRAFLPHIKCNRAVQVVNQPDTFNIIRQGDCNILIISAEEFLRYLI